ncbi:acyl carrier protein [Streptomyces sp. NPDC058195]|uniref:acyl carrier protein n=1 Tax=Streptomyces sp. NPDC058195 TaxID=3346375 RepID=UPI0036EAC335
MGFDLLETVDEMFRRELQVAEIKPGVPLVDYGLDSIRSISLVVEMEVRFDVRISDEQAAAMRTLSDVVDQIAGLLTVRVGHGEDTA